jgi:acylphosphatase
MITQVEICLRNTHYELGFGFAIMKMAYRLGITGRMDYIPGMNIEIQAEGEQREIADFIQWTTDQVKNPDHIQLKKIRNCKRKFKEFDIYLHSDEKYIFLNLPKNNTNINHL